MSNISQGPWTATEDNAAHGMNIYSATGVRIGHTMEVAKWAPHGPVSPEEAKANARVMAAAFELLGMVRRYASECSYCNEKPSGLGCGYCLDVRALIRKAEGA